jgi:hypothetical protein
METEPVYVDAELVEDTIGHAVEDVVIVAAEEDIDDLGLGAVDRSTAGRKLDPDALTAIKLDGLQRAVIEQIRYRELMGSTFFSKAQRSKGSADGVSFEGKLPHLSPRALTILADVGLVNRWGSMSSRDNLDLEDIGYA